MNIVKTIIVALVIFGLLGCASLGKEKKVEGNVFHSPYPKMVVEVAPNYEYLGRKVEKIVTEEIHEGSKSTRYVERFDWSSNIGWFQIGFLTIPASHMAEWMHPSYYWKKVSNVQDKGDCKLGKYTYAYCLDKDKYGRFIKTFARNTPDGRTMVLIVFRSKLRSATLSEFEKDCDNAFKIIIPDG